MLHAAKCLTKCVVCQAAMTTPSNEKQGIGIKENLFKTRFANHKATSNCRSKRTATELNNYIWDLRNRVKVYYTNWRIIKQAPSFGSNYHRCNLCLWERYYISFRPEMTSLNKLSKLIAACRHKRKYTLAHYKV